MRTFAHTLRYKVLCAICVIDLCRRGGADGGKIPKKGFLPSAKKILRNRA